MSLRQLKNLIESKERAVQKAGSSPDYKDLALRRRFNVLAGGQGEYCTWEASEIRPEKRTEHESEEDGYTYYCENDKAGLECVGYTGENSGRLCAMTDASGTCPERCMIRQKE